jgi:hypothetical protein
MLNGLEASDGLPESLASFGVLYGHVQGCLRTSHRLGALAYSTPDEKFFHQ